MSRSPSAPPFRRLAAPLARTRSRALSEADPTRYFATFLSSQVFPRTTQTVTEMAYTIPNARRFKMASASPWFKYEAALKLLNSLNRCDFSVIASRRETHQAINDFNDNGVPGYSLFGPTSRFPDDIGSIFLSRFDTNTRTCLIGLATVLSWRASNEAKDVKAGKPTRGEIPDENGNDRRSSMQETQDNTKRFEELTKEFANLLNNPDAVWDRDVFERHFDLTYA